MRWPGSIPLSVLQLVSTTGLRDLEYLRTRHAIDILFRQCQFHGIEANTTMAYYLQANKMAGNVHQPLKAAFNAHTTSPHWFDEFSRVLLCIHSSWKDPNLSATKRPKPNILESNLPIYLRILKQLITSAIESICTNILFNILMANPTALEVRITLC